MEGSRARGAGSACDTVLGSDAGLLAGVLAFTPDGRTVLADRGAGWLLGDRPGDVRAFVDLVHGLGAGAAALVGLRAALQSDKRTVVELDLADGRRLQAVVDPDGAGDDEDRRLVVSLVDVSALELHGGVRRELVEVMENARVGLMVLRPVTEGGRVTDFEVAFVNDQARRSGGEPVTAGQRVSQLTGPLGRAYLPRYVAVHDSGRPEVSELHVELDGADAWFDVLVRRLPSGVVVSTHDVTAQRQAVDRLEELQRMLRSSQQVANLGSYEWHVGRDELRWTDQMYEVVQVDKETFGHTYADFLALLHPDDREVVDTMVRESIGHGTPYRGDMRRLLPDGRVIVLHSEAQMVYERGHEPRFVGTLQDVTRARELEETIRRTQRVESLGQMAAGVAHDFNNVLTLVTMHAHMLRASLEQAGVRPELTEDLDGVEEAAARATALTRRLLAFTGQQVRRPTVLDVAEVVTGMLPMLRRMVGEQVALTVDAAEGCAVRADRTQLEQVLLNLVGNARDAVDGRGNVEVRVRTVSGDHPAVDQGAEPVSPLSRWVLLQVTDDGTGMSEEARQHAFDPFFTTKPQGKGTGLGLSVVFGIVQQSDGRFAIDSAVGQGTTMSVALPLHTGEAEQEDAPARPARTTGTETVLVVEDDPGVRELAARTLRDHGYAVVDAEDGEEALSLLAARDDVAAVVSDVAMPRMGGIDLHRAVRDKHPHVAVLLMSGYTPPDALPDDPRTAFLPKPLTGESLSAALREVLDR